MSVNLRWRWQYLMLIAIAVLGVLFKINLLSAGWNIAVGLIVTAVLHVVLGLEAANDGACTH